MYHQGNIEVLTGIDVSSTTEEPLSNHGPAKDDPFSDRSLFERMKFPNQCSSYQSHIKPLREAGRIMVSLELLGPHSICVSY